MPCLRLNTYWTHLCPAETPERLAGDRVVSCVYVCVCARARAIVEALTLKT